MKYNQPYDQPSNPTAPYVDLNEAMGVDGSVPPAKFFNDVQAEILAVITGAGLTPSSDNLHQLLDAILALIPPPIGGPSDSSLVHFGTDDGAANSVILTISPTTLGVSSGFIVFFRPAATNTGEATITVNLSPSGNITKRLRRGDGGKLIAGDMLAGQLACAVCTDDVDFRLAWLHNRGVVTDGATIFGTGTDADPLIALARGPGVEVGQFVDVAVHIAGSYSNPTQAGFALGQIYPASALLTGNFGSGINGNLTGVFAMGGASTGSAAPWPAPASAIEGTVTGNWRLIGWVVSSGVIGITQFNLRFRRVN